MSTEIRDEVQRLTAACNDAKAMRNEDIALEFAKRLRIANEILESVASFESNGTKTDSGWYLIPPSVMERVRVHLELQGKREEKVPNG